MKHNLLIGKVIEVTFFDHSINEAGHVPCALTCRALGRVVSVDSKNIYLAYWQVDDPDPKVRMDNQEVMAIILKTIVHYEVLI
jgi:hypothetical protein